MDEKDADRWMDPWLPHLRRATSSNAPVLELGCDTGRDTAWLTQQGFDVVATDISTDALAQCAKAAPSARCVCHDLRNALPFGNDTFGAVVASLCLHYFDWATTVAAVSEISRCIRPGGLFLCRVNSVRDYLHGAGEGEEIEPNFFRQAARYATSKRFFTSEDLDRLFEGGDWTELSRREVTVLRYSAPKIAWEVGVVRAV
jgi:SAM-dependent methyltransferase